MRTVLTHITCMLALVLIMSCDKNTSTGSEVKTFTLLPWMESDAGKNVPLSISAPSSWVIEKDANDMVSFRPPDVTKNESIGLLNVNLFSCPDSEKGADCIERWVKRHFYEAAPAELLREEAGESRIWITSSAGKDGKRVSARYYVYNSGKLAVVNFQLGGETFKNLATYKEIGGTLAFTSSK